MVNNLFLPLMFPFPSITTFFDHHVLHQPPRQCSCSNLQLASSIFLVKLRLVGVYLIFRANNHQCGVWSFLSQCQWQPKHRLPFRSRSYFKQQEAQVKASLLVPNPSGSVYKWSFSPAKDQKPTATYPLQARLIFRMHIKLDSSGFIYMRSRVWRGGY